MIAGRYNYQYFAVNEEEGSVIMNDQLVFVSVIGESRAAYLSVVSEYCCGEPGALHKIGIVRNLAELGALIKPDAAGQPRFECHNCQPRNSPESPPSVPVAETAAAADDQDPEDGGAADQSPGSVTQPISRREPASHQSAKRRVKKRAQGAGRSQTNRSNGQAVSRAGSGAQNSAQKIAAGANQERVRRQRLPVLRLAAKLRQVRHLKGFTQGRMLQEVNPREKTGSNRARVSQYENGVRTPSLVEIYNYARLAGVAVETLVDDCLDLPI